MSEESINKMKNIYILSKQTNKKTLNTIKLKKEEKIIFFIENEKGNNKKYNNKNISILEYFIKNKNIIKIFGNLFVEENKKKCRIIINNKEKEFKN